MKWLAKRYYGMILRVFLRDVYVVQDRNDPEDITLIGPFRTKEKAEAWIRGYPEQYRYRCSVETVFNAKSIESVDWWTQI